MFRGTDWSTCFWIGLMATATVCFGAGQDKLVRSDVLGLEFRAPEGWIVRNLAADDEHVVAITRELLDGFPRYHAGFSATSVNTERRRRKVGATAMARGLCLRARQQGTATSECRETNSEGFTRVEWRVSYPPDSRTTSGTIAWVVCLADDANDSLVRLVFEAPQPEWSQLESIATEMMTSVRRMQAEAG